MMDIQEKLKEIGPFVPGADDDMLICRCEEVTKGENSKSHSRGHCDNGGNETISEKWHGALSGTDLWKISKRNYGKRASRKTDGY